MGSGARHAFRSCSSAVSLERLYLWQSAASASQPASSPESRSLGGVEAHRTIKGTINAPDQRMFMFTSPNSLRIKAMACSVAF